jgi:photosystem II stability/assembly factor-like uncharacterized protein
MKKLFCFFIFIASASKFSGQIWQTLTPFPDPRITILSAPDSLHLKAIKSYTLFTYSNNGGISWNDVPLNLPLGPMYFSSEQKGWIGSDSGKVIHTTNGGQTWNTIQLNSTKYFSNVQFINDSVGFFLCYGSDSIFITHDEGLNWNGYKTNISIQQNKKLLFKDALHGWIANGIYDPYLYRTVDGGITWIADTLPSPMGGYFNNGIYFTDSLNGWITGENSIMRTTDGGNNWSIISTAMGGDIAFTDTLNGVRVDFPLNVYLTNDGGINWNIVFSNPDYNSNQSNSGPFVSVCNHGYFISGSDGTTIFSMDGNSWRFITWNRFPYFSIYNVGAIFNMSSAAKGIFVTPTDCTNNACGNNTYVTTDSGQTWHSISQSFLNQGVFILNDSNWFIIDSYYNTDSCVLFRSKNQMQTAQPLATIHHQMHAIFYLDTLHAVFGGDSIFYSNDGGNNWNPSIINGLTGYPEFISFSFVDQLNGWVLSDNSVAKTTDGGHSWNIIYTDPLSNHQYHKIQFTDSIHGYILSYYGNLLKKTIDGGINWTDMQFQATINDFVFTDSINGWMATDSGIYYTHDGLNTIQLQDHHPVNCISFIDSVHGYSVAPNLFLSTDQTGIINGTKNDIDGYETTKIYPNPTYN